ncbi:MAG: aminotransferase class I/II-fold pyridoxal phosphate-dependent enzyme [Catenulispora sp.]|nr:aminotransferase class I/II-fold pyridoxal phosphate-dependent enzyme [Catenulispora sp.]
MTGALPYPPHSRRAGSLRGSALADLVVLGRESGAVDLSAGVPAFPDPPQAVVEAAVEALREGLNQYDDPRGNRQLREQLAARQPIRTDPETELTVTTGATEGLCAAVLATVDPGDEVVVLEPFYEGFHAAVRLAGGVLRTVPLRRPGWRWDPEDLAAAFGPQTRAVILNSPANPTGRALDAGELAELAEHVERWGVTVISDEVYAGLVFDGRPHISVLDVPGLAERGIVVGSLSKWLAVSGWRLGYVRADAARTRALRKVHEVTTQGTAAPLQAAIARSGVLRDEGWDPAPGLAERRDLIQAALSGFGFRFHPGEGGCFLLADVSGVSDLRGADFCRWLVAEYGVLVVPGTAFFDDPEEGGRYVRVAFNRTPETLAAAADRLARGDRP